MSKDVSRVSLKDFPEDVIQALLLDHPRSEWTRSGIAYMMSANPKYAKASMSGMENRVSRMADEGLLTGVQNPQSKLWKYRLNTHHRKHDSGSGFVEHLDDSVISEPQPELDPQPQVEVPILSPRIFGDRVELSISDFTRLMQSLEAAS